MKRKLSLALTVILTVLTLGTSTVFDANLKEGYLNYIVNDSNTVTITVLNDETITDVLYPEPLTAKKLPKFKQGRSVGVKTLNP